MILKIISAKTLNEGSHVESQTTSTRYVEAPIIEYDRNINDTEIEIELQDYNFRRLGIIIVESPADIYFLNDNGTTIDYMNFYTKK